VFIDITKINIGYSLALTLSSQTKFEENKNLLNELYACHDAMMTVIEEKFKEKLNSMADHYDYDDYDDGEEEEEEEEVVVEDGIIQQQQQETAVQALMQNPQVLEAITQVIEG